MYTCIVIHVNKLDRFPFLSFLALPGLANMSSRAFRFKLEAMGMVKW